AAPPPPGLALRPGSVRPRAGGPGAFPIAPRRLTGAARRGVRTIDDYLRVLGTDSSGAVRVSFGVASTFGDVQRLLDFIDSGFRDRHPDPAGLPARANC
ncbi:cysteine desulfurase, partial [Actinoplanes sp. NPDC051633]